MTMKPLGVPPSLEHSLGGPRDESPNSVERATAKGALRLVPALLRFLRRLVLGQSPADFLADYERTDPPKRRPLHLEARAQANQTRANKRAVDSANRRLRRDGGDAA